MANRIFIPQPEIKPASIAVKVQSLNHWTTRGVSLKTIS